MLVKSISVLRMILGVSNPDYNHVEQSYRMHITGNPLAHNNKRTYIQTELHHNKQTKLLNRILIYSQMAFIYPYPSQYL
jgi:hypothetical protein